MALLTTKPAYREPWQHGAKAYPEADNLEALREGTKRKRKHLMVHLAHEGFGHLPCASCGIPIGDKYGDHLNHQDKWGTGHYFPKTKRLVVQHYYCSWGTLMNEVIRLGRFINI